MDCFCFLHSLVRQEEKIIPEKPFTTEVKANLTRLSTLLESLTEEGALAVVEENPDMFKGFHLT